MKVFAFILSVYFVFLFSVPCCALDNCSEEKTAQETNHESSDGDCGSCSPFFTCTGCTGFTLSTENNNLEIISYFSGHQYAGYILSPVSDVHYDFWQPPKLG
jgi:hypothetical protein